jgi:HEAT repeat protein
MGADDKPSLPPSLAAREAARRGDVALLVEMLSSSEPRARISAVGQLRKLRDPRAIPGLLHALEDPDSIGKVGVLKALGEMGDVRLADHVFAVADSASEPFDVRGTAAQTLLAFGDRRGVTTLASLFGETTKKHHTSFRKWAVRLLVDANGIEALPALRAARSKGGVLERRRLGRAIRALERVKTGD